jgi:RNA polymerase sigma factor (sigma-70 family)
MRRGSASGPGRRCCRWAGWPAGWLRTPTRTTSSRTRWPGRGRSAGSSGPTAARRPPGCSRSRPTRRGRLRLVDDTAEVPEAAAHDRGADLDLERAIARLTDRQQLAVHLHYFLGLSVIETAAVLHCSDGTVKSTLFDARTRLRAELGDDDD